MQVVEGENLEVDPPRRLVQTCAALWGDDVKARAPRASPGKSTRSAIPVGSSSPTTSCAAGANEQVYGGWPMVLSGLKTWLETGELLTTPGS